MHLAFFFQQYQVYLSERMSLKKDHNIDAKKVLPLIYTIYLTTIVRGDYDGQFNGRAAGMASHS
ncbi:hypothetical protein IGI52_003551 [Enterococcus sp. DIV0187]